VTIILLALAALQGTPVDAPSCAAMVRASPEQAIAAADAWRLRGGGLEARNCLGLAYAAAERWAPAAAAFEQAAREAEGRREGRSADFWAQSGNAWLAAGNAAAAVKAFDAALATSALQAELRGEVHLDRARAQVALGGSAAARADLDRGLSLVPADPFGWYLSAALARRDNDLARAQKDIAKAIELAPHEPRLLLEGGNIAGLSGDLAAARALHARAAKADPEGEAGRAAAAALLANTAAEAEAPAAPAAPKPAPQSR